MREGRGGGRNVKRIRTYQKLELILAACVTKNRQNRIVHVAVSQQRQVMGMVKPCRSKFGQRLLIDSKIPIGSMLKVAFTGDSHTTSSVTVLGTSKSQLSVFTRLTILLSHLLSLGAHAHEGYSTQFVVCYQSPGFFLLLYDKLCQIFYYQNSIKLFLSRDTAFFTVIFVVSSTDERLRILLTACRWRSSQRGEL